MPHREHGEATAKPPKAGRILRLKCGYNPNSSSIGTILFAMPAAMIGMTVAFGAAAGLLGAAVLHKRHDAPQEPTEPADGDEPSSDGEPSSDTDERS